MFDLRYHVASLAAVFVALLIGILVGVAMSGKVDDAEKQSLQSDVNRLEAELDAASERTASDTREQQAFRTFVRNAYPALIADRATYERRKLANNQPSSGPRIAVGNPSLPSTAVDR